ncbi:MAG: hypothetical protein U0325_36560 [Polyangiales bacterium]
MSPPENEPRPRRRGRPEVPEEDRKSVTLRIRLTSSLRREFEEAARLAEHDDVSSWLRDLGARAATRLRAKLGTPASARTADAAHPAPTPPDRTR